MRKNKTPKTKQLKVHREKESTNVKNYIVYFIIAFFMVFLTSSFVIESVYNNADRIVTTPEGVKEIYEVSIGMSSFEKIIEENQNTSTTSNTRTAEPAATPSPTAEVQAQPTPTAEQPAPSAAAQ